MIEQLDPLAFEFDTKAAEFSAFRRSDRYLHSSDRIAQDDNPRGAGSRSILVGYAVALLTETEVGRQAQCENNEASHLSASRLRSVRKTSPFLAAKRNPRTLTFSTRSENLLNHTNVTVVNTILSSGAVGQPVAAETARRVELGVRFAF
jgi:hypothetical protein